MFKYNAVFQKKGDIIFISHLDVMTLFRRSMRRANLPFILTKGFTPRVKISMPQALKLGKESDDEKMSFWLTEKIDTNVLKEKINEQLPEGISIFEIRDSDK